MAIDSAYKRKAVINFGLPGLKLLPIPDGNTTELDRRQLTDSYPIAAIPISRSGWVKDTVPVEIWVPDTVITNTWVKDTVVVTEPWVRDTEIEEF